MAAIDSDGWCRAGESGKVAFVAGSMKDGRKKDGRLRAGAKPSSASQSKSNRSGTVVFVCVFLALITLTVFAGTVRYEFTNYDDGLYVYENALVSKGLTSKGLAAAFTHAGVDNWVPLTTMSHMADCQFYRLNAGGHHATNVVLHVISVILLFLLLRRMTGGLWPSAFVAAVFAIHPLHVESVAWVAERKDVLSGLFGVMALMAYVGYAGKSTVHSPQSTVWYAWTLVLFALSLMAKPMLVTLPFVMLLLDYWPLRRFSSSGESNSRVTEPGLPRRSAAEAGTRNTLQLLLEKLPFLALSVALCVITLRFQQSYVKAAEVVPFSLRIENAAVSCVTYIVQMFYPARLAVFYPYPGKGLPMWEVLGAGAILVAISLAAFIWRRTRPYLLVGWLWYLGMLVPVIGLVQVGTQAHADRYTYLPMLGLCLMLSWGAVEVFTRWRSWRGLLGMSGVVAIAALAFLGWRQTAFWRNNETLWTHTLECTTGNPLAHNNLGEDLLQRHQLDAAMVQFRAALEIKPDYADALYNVGVVMLEKEQWDEAAANFKQALALDSNSARAHNNLGYALLQKGRTDEALVHLNKAVALEPDNVEAQNNLGNALFQKGQLDEAIAHFQKAVEINPNALEPNNSLGAALFQKGQVDAAIVYLQKVLVLRPDYAEAHNNLGTALLQKGKIGEALAQYQTAMEIGPGNVDFQNNFARAGWKLVTSSDVAVRNPARALALMQQADQACGGKNPLMAATLAEAYAQTGSFSDALETARRALELAAGENNADMVTTVQAQIKAYLAGAAFGNVQ
jgi:tetratricopeptide (TPR) repeat protein